MVKTAEQLIKTGKAQHPVIGVVLDREFTGDGVRILPKESDTSGPPVDPQGPAAKAGIKAGDVIVEFDGRKVTDPDDLVVAIRAKSVGDAVSTEGASRQRDDQRHPHPVRLGQVASGATCWTSTAGSSSP